MSRVELYEGEKLKTGDTAPDLRAKLIKDNGVARDLSSVDEVRIVLDEARASDNVVDDDTTGEVLMGGSNGDGSNGYVQYSWQAADTETARTLRGEFIVTPSAGEQETYPNAGYFEVYIEEGLA
jgi:hypothetical protein